MVDVHLIYMYMYMLSWYISLLQNVSHWNWIPGENVILKGACVYIRVKRKDPVVIFGVCVHMSALDRDSNLPVLSISSREYAHCV